MNVEGTLAPVPCIKNGSVDSSKALSAGTYYLGVTCANTQKYETSYNVNIGMLA